MPIVKGSEGSTPGPQNIYEDWSLLRTTLSCIADALIATDVEGRVTLLNPAATLLTGWAEDEAKGQTIEAVFHIVNEETREPVHQPVKKVMESGTIQGLAKHTILIARDGTERAIDDLASPLRGDDGAFRGVVIVFRDITERRQAEKSLLASEERLRLAVAAGGIGLWDWDLASGDLVWNPNHESIWGYETGTPHRTYRDFIDRVHPDDLDRFTAAIATAREGGQDFGCEFRLVQPGGSIRWVSARGWFFRDTSGRAVRSVGAVVDMTVQKEAETLLKEGDRRKDEFLAMLAHEMRNPLASILNAVQILRFQEEADALQRQAKTILEGQVGQLIRLVDDLLEVSRITSGVVHLELGRCHLADVVERAVESIKFYATAFHNKVYVLEHDDSIWLMADAARLEQVLVNLLNNAVKFTPPGGMIMLRFERDADDVVLRVRDTGIGIAPEMLPRVFDLFTQETRSLDRSQGGLGIGLTLVRKIVELHGGRVEAFSGGKGHGTEFVVRLPAEPAAAIAQRPSVTEPPAPPAIRRRLLVVDDNIPYADSLGNLLRLAGYEVEVVYSGPAAIRAVSIFPPDVLILDVGLPEMDGYDVARRLRRDYRPEMLRIVGVSGYGNALDRQLAVDAGFDDYLVKPVPIGDLVNCLGV
jgi:PAS domain S-box-containing protein